MKELSHYLHDLDEVQWLTFLQYLELLPDKNEPWKKIRQLAELVRGEKDKNLGAAYYSKILYGEEKTDTIERMERMLKKRYLEFITLDYNLSADEKDFDYVSIQLEKKATAFRTLSRTKNSHGSERDLLDEIIKVAKEYECYPVLVAHLKLKKQYWSHLGQENYDALCSEIECYKKNEDAAALTTDCLCRLQMLEHYNKSENPLDFINKKIPLLKKIVADYNYKYAVYVLKLFEQEEQTLLKNYERAAAICFEIVEIVEKNKQIKTRHRMGIAQAQLSKTLIYSNRFSASIKHARKSLEYFPYASPNYICSKEDEFYGLFYNKEYIKAEECIRFILAHSSAEESGEFHYAIFNLLLANVLFMQKKFAEALQLLQGPLEISQDKAGWAIGLRLLRILIHIELAKHDEASKQIEQLRKFIEFTESNQTEVTLRNKTIVKFLSLADKAGFVFSRLNGKAHEHLSELKTGNNGNAWEYFSSELIPIHEWATSTTKKP